MMSIISKDSSLSIVAGSHLSSSPRFCPAVYSAPSAKTVNFRFGIGHEHERRGIDAVHVSHLAERELIVSDAPRRRDHRPPDTQESALTTYSIEDGRWNSAEPLTASATPAAVGTSRRGTEQLNTADGHDAGQQHQTHDRWPALTTCVATQVVHSISNALEGTPPPAASCHRLCN